MAFTPHERATVNQCKIQLEDQSKTSNFDIECYNLAQINNYISQDLLNANLFFHRLKPDYVISFSGWNEIAASYLLNQKKIKKIRYLFYGGSR